MRKFLCGAAPAHTPALLLPHYLPQIKKEELIAPRSACGCYILQFLSPPRGGYAHSRNPGIETPRPAAQTEICNYHRYKPIFVSPLVAKCGRPSPSPSRTSRFFVPPQCHLLNYSYVTSIVKENVIFVSFSLSCEMSCRFYTLFFFFVLLPFVFAVWPFACVSFSVPHTAFGVPLPRAAYRAGAGAARFLLQSVPLLLYFVPKTRFGLFVFWCTAPIIGFVLGFFTVRSFFGVIFFATIHLVILYFLQSGPPQQRKKKHYAATFHHL